MDAHMQELQHAWEQLLQVFGVEPARAQAAFATLVDAYNSPGRVYHTLEHVQDVLAWIEKLRDHTSDLPAVRLAAWFHDCIYDPHVTDNEERSASYAQKMLSGLALPATTLQAVSHMIVSTKTHQVEPGNQDCQLLLDADLAIFGAAPQRYDVYAQAIRQEYSWIPEAAYRVGRAQVLRSFLQRTRIYCTKFMYVELEKQARENILRELQMLAG